MWKLWLFLPLFVQIVASANVPMAINTWPFTDSTQKAWEFLKKGHNAIDSVEAGCSVCEKLQCDGTVGFGGSPDENGETTLDALIFDGKTMDMGAVGSLRRIKDAISVAKHVLKYTSHSLLVGSQATAFAKQMGFKEESLSTDKSYKIWMDWKVNSCQKNSWMNVKPDPKSYCGPYKPLSENSVKYKKTRKDLNSKNHDTIGMIAIDKDNNIAAGTSTNGMTHKIPGRVGDSPIPGAGAYADNEVGAATATGDGDVMMRFLPSYLAVEEMRWGVSPTEAAKVAIRRMSKKYPDFFGGVVAVNKDGVYGAACNGMDTFRYSVVNAELGKVVVVEVPCSN